MIMLIKIAGGNEIGFSDVEFSQSRTQSRLEDNDSTAVGQSVNVVRREIVFACLVD